MEFITGYKFKEKCQVAQQKDFEAQGPIDVCVGIQHYQFLGCITFGKLFVSLFMCHEKRNNIHHVEDGCENYVT